MRPPHIAAHVGRRPRGARTEQAGGQRRGSRRTARRARWRGRPLGSEIRHRRASLRRTSSGGGEAESGGGGRGAPCTVHGRRSLLAASVTVTVRAARQTPHGTLIEGVQRCPGRAPAGAYRAAVSCVWQSGTPHTRVPTATPRRDAPTRERDRLSVCKASLGVASARHVARLAPGRAVVRRPYTTHYALNAVERPVSGLHPVSTLVVIDT